MPIPARLRPPDLDAEEVHRFCGLCDDIETGVIDGADVSALLAKWNARANRQYQAREFADYYGATDKLAFVSEALLPRPTRLDDLRADEVLSVLEDVRNATLPEQYNSYFLTWLDVQFPNADVSDLIYWPDQWFDVSEALDEDLSAAQLLCALMERTGRKLPGAVHVELPWPVPK